MNNEVKKFINESSNYDVIDYITNLQQKVERLEKENKRLNNIINKAIEYIENEKYKQNSVGVYTKDIHKNLLKILKGDE